MSKAQIVCGESDVRMWIKKLVITYQMVFEFMKDLLGLDYTISHHNNCTSIFQHHNKSHTIFMKRSSFTS